MILYLQGNSPGEEPEAPWGKCHFPGVPAGGAAFPQTGLGGHSAQNIPRMDTLTHLTYHTWQCPSPNALAHFGGQGAGRGLFIYGLQCSGMPGGTLEAKWRSLKMHPRTSPRLWVTHSDLQGPSRMNHRAPTRTWLILPSLQPPNKQVKRGWLTCLRPHSPWLS